MQFYVLCVVLFAYICGVDCATKCYKCEQCQDLISMEVINCASHWHTLANLSYDTKYSCQANSESLRNVTKYTLSCTPTSACTMSTQIQESNGAWKWSKCCLDDLCNLDLVSSGPTSSLLSNRSMTAFICLAFSILVLN